MDNRLHDALDDVFVAGVVHQISVDLVVVIGDMKGLIGVLLSEPS